MMKNVIRVCAFVACVMGATQAAQAIGRVYARLPNSSSSTVYNLRIKSLTASVRIDDQLAVTHVDQEFANDNALRLEGFYVFKLPEGAQVHEMYLWINGVRVPYEVKRREEAVVQYSEIVRGMADPAILEQLGPNLFKLRIFPIDPFSTRRIEITYTQTLTYYKGSVQYVFPMDMRDYTSAAIERAAVAIEFNSHVPVADVETSVDQYPAAVQVTKVTDYSYRVTYGVEDVTFAKDFKVRFTLNRGNTLMNALAYHPVGSPAEAPYFLLWSAVPDSLGADSIEARELTFAADVSSSMEGERMVQLKEALLSFVDLLADEDRFNIVAFGTGTVPFRPDLVPATPSTKAEARAFIAGLVALGLTNFESALQASLAQSYSDSLHGALLFLTDGQPTWGESRPDSLLALANRENTSRIKIFPVAVGEEPDNMFLRNLASQSGGTFWEILADDSIYVKVRDLYRILFLPKLRSIAFSFDQITATELFPFPIPEVYAGDQVLIAGRYAGSGVSHVVMSGTMAGAPLVIEDTVAFPDSGSTLLEVSRYWGAQKIKSVLNLIAQVGEQQELVDQVIALSIKYSVLTPYTAFLVVEPTGQGPTHVDEGETPMAFALDQNYPNPFNPSTQIRYSIGAGGPYRVYLTIHDILGRIVRTLVAEVQPSGVYQVSWDGTDDHGRMVASGLYTYRISAGDFVSARTMLLLK